jgi:hypothetical protein
MIFQKLFCVSDGILINCLFEIFAPCFEVLCFSALSIPLFNIFVLCKRTYFLVLRLYIVDPIVVPTFEVDEAEDLVRANR